jgi:hypothetical protein
MPRAKDEMLNTKPWPRKRGQDQLAARNPSTSLRTGCPVAVSGAGTARRAVIIRAKQSQFLAFLA